MFVILLSITIRTGLFQKSDMKKAKHAKVLTNVGKKYLYEKRTLFDPVFYLAVVFL